MQVEQYIVTLVPSRKMNNVIDATYEFLHRFHVIMTGTTQVASDHQDCIPQFRGIFEIKKQQSPWPNKQPI